MTSALNVEALSVSFGATEVFRDLTFNVPEGTSLSIVGLKAKVDPFTIDRQYEIRAER